MTGAEIAQLIIILGPGALKLIENLANTWTKQLTPEEVKAMCADARKTVEQFHAEAHAKLTAAGITPRAQ